MVQRRDFYDAKNLATYKESAGDATPEEIAYTYDSAGRVTDVVLKDGTATELEYAYGNLDSYTSRTAEASSPDGDYSWQNTVIVDDVHNRISAEEYTAAGMTYTTTYTYDEEDRLKSIEVGKYKETARYDSWGRLMGISGWYNDSHRVADFGYTYQNYGQRIQITDYGHATKSWQSASNAIAVYDSAGYITELYNDSSGDRSAEYTYDANGRLYTETYGNDVKVYSYDANGNISQVSGGKNETYTYTGGRLMSFNNGTYYTFSYDGMGNPTTYKNSSLSWTRGRMLKSGTQKGNSFEYKYDAENLRYEKTVNGVTTRYYYNAGQLQAEERGEDFIYYLYGIDGIAGMIYNGQYYIYEKNILGDVIGIYNSNGVQEATYDYDAWGNVVRKSGTMADINPIRYRGYYYDEETGFYYLNTRYYDPEIRRFVNADSYELLPELAGVYGQANLYTYCNNNPVMYTDPTGEIGIFLPCLIAFGIGAAAGFGSSAISQGLTYGWENISWGQAIFDGAMGGITGILSVFGLGAGVQAGIGAISGLASYVVDFGVHGQEPTFLGALLATGIGAIANASVGYLIEYGGFKHAFRQAPKRIVDLSVGKFSLRVIKGLAIPTFYQIANIGYSKIKSIFEGAQSSKTPYWW